LANQESDNIRNRTSAERGRQQRRTRSLAVAPGHDSPQLISELLESIPDPVIGWDAGGRVVYWSEAARQTYGFAAQEAVGQPVVSLLQTRFPMPFLEIMEEVTDLGRWHGQLVHRDKAGREHTVESRWVARYDEVGKLVGGLGIERKVGGLDESEQPQISVVADHDRSVSERRDRDLWRSERLESLSQLAGGVAHDFNNALAVIINYAAFVCGELDQVYSATGEPRWASMREDLGEIQTAAERAASLTHQLLAFSRQEVGAPFPLDLSESISGLAELLQQMLGEHIFLQTKLAEDLGQVYADPGQIEQVLVNLAANARDAMPRGGTLTIDTATVELDDGSVAAYPELTPGPHVRLRVSDTGIGMTPRVLEHVFDPFFTTKQVGRGTGLGLSSVYGIITQMGGHARFYSEPNVGTTFVALLPVGPDDVPIPAPPRRPAAPVIGGGETILLVEDERALREVARRVLVGAGYEVIAAADGPAALDAVAGREREIDLLLTDMVMPGMLGPALAEQLRARHPAVRILYVSGFIESVLGQATPVGARQLIEKPFTAPALLEQVSLALGS
jgi:PAS domain S-box-containing protein